MSRINRTDRRKPVIVLNDELLKHLPTYSETGCIPPKKKVRLVGGVFLPIDKLVEQETVVFGTPTHGDVACFFVGFLNNKRKFEGKEPLTDKECNVILNNSVDIIFDDHVSLRPNPNKMSLAFRADQALQEVVSKDHIRFLGILKEKVRLAVKKQGEYWRIPPPPRTPEEQKDEINGALTPIATEVNYFYNKDSGVRILTYDNFSKIGALPPDQQQICLQEIANYAPKKNKHGNPEVSFFQAKNFGAKEFLNSNYNFEELLQKFQDAIPEVFQKDDLDNKIYRHEMLRALFQGDDNDSVLEEVLLGLCPEFHMHVRWLPGAKILNGRFVDFDTIFTKSSPKPWDCHFKPSGLICDLKVKEFILNALLEYPKIEYINFGEIYESVSRRAKMPGRRGVYIVAIKIPQVATEIVKIIRMQKWGFIEYAEKNSPHPAFESARYRMWVRDRYSICERLGMKVPSIRMSEISELYKGTVVPTGYYERRYIKGVATDRIQPNQYKNSAYPPLLAKFLGEAAALNMIVGRVNPDKQVLFDDGDEIIEEDDDGLPCNLSLSNITGALYDFDTNARITPSLDNYAKEYAGPVNRRKELVDDIEEFANIYLESFAAQFKKLQKHHKEHRDAYYNLFEGRIVDPGGNVVFRWQQVLDRLEKTNVDDLINKIRDNIDC